MGPRALVFLVLGLMLTPGCACGDSHTVLDAASPPRADASLDGFWALDAPGLDARGEDAPGLDAGLDAAGLDAAGPDAGGVCLTRALESMRIEELTSLEALDVHAGRSFRVQARYTQPDGCHARAMTKVEIDPATRTVDVTVRDWVTNGTGCAELARLDARTITLRLESGDWTIRDASPGGTATMRVTIGPGIRSPCVPDGGDCLQDCDCLGREVCLSTLGVGGPFTSCAEPCEDDVDCSEAGDHCLSVDDGFELACQSSGLGCEDPTRPCPHGYACTARRCEPTFVLGSATRTECTCDAECAPGLSCVTGAGGSRCEVTCPTAGAWCSGMHFCAEARQDVAGLAPEDAVCGWVGE
jgi:hypothetical protein